MRVVAPVLVWALIIGIWLAVSYVLLEPRRRFLMPPPWDVVRVGLFDARNVTEILGGLWSTTQVAIVGLLVLMPISRQLGKSTAQAPVRQPAAT